MRLLGTGSAGLVGDVGLASSDPGTGGGMVAKRGDVGNVGDGSAGGGGGGDRMTGAGAWAWGSPGTDGLGFSDNSSSDSDPALGDFRGVLGRALAAAT